MFATRGSVPNNKKLASFQYKCRKRIFVPTGPMWFFHWWVKQIMRLWKDKYISEEETLEVSWTVCHNTVLGPW